MSKMLGFMRIAVLILVSCAFIYTFVCSQQSEADKDALYRKATQLLDDYEGNTALLVEAQRCLEQIIKADANFALAYVGMARVLLKAAYISYDNYEGEKLKEAHKYIAKALAIEPGLFDAYRLSSYIYFSQKDMPNAKKALEEVEKIKPGSGDAVLLRAEFAYADKNYDEAIARAKEVLAMTNNKVLLMAAYGILDEAYNFKKEYTLAEEAYEAQLKLKPNSVWTKINYSSFLIRRKRYDEAIEMAESALQDMEFSMGRHTLAEAYYKRAVEYCWTKKEYEKAEADFKASLANEPDRANAYYGLGICYRFIADKKKNKELLKKSEESLKKALELNPQHEQAKLELKKHYEWVGENER